MESGNVLKCILNSGRLLSEHIDIISVTLDQSQTASGSCRQPQLLMATTTGALLLSTSGLALLASKFLHVPNRLAQRTALLVVPSAVVFAWGCRIAWITCVTRWRLWSLHKFLRRLNGFDVSMRRNVKCVREWKRLDLLAAPNQRQFYMQLVQTQRAVITALVTEVQRLEQNRLPDELLDLYQPLESLSDCELFQRSADDLDPSNVKDFHQIFQYVQSQLLTRLALLCAAHNPDAAYAFIRTAIPQLSSMLANHLAIDTFAQQTLTTSTALQLRLNERRANHSSSTLHPQADQTMPFLRALSLDVVAKFLAIAVEMRRLDEVLQSETELVPSTLRNQAAAIGQIEEVLSECAEDFQRLVLSYHRLVNGREAPGELATLNSAAITNNETLDEPPRMFNECLLDQRRPDAEFYALLDRDDAVGDDSPSKPTSNGLDLDDALHTVDGRIVKRHFRPVLRQLKDRIEPINTAMRDRERQFLLASGLEVTPVAEEQSAAPSGSDSDDDQLDEFGRMRKRRGGGRQHGWQTHRNGLDAADIYEESRRFLAAKVPIDLASGGGLMALPRPQRMMEEEILE